MSATPISIRRGVSAVPSHSNPRSRVNFHSLMSIEQLPKPLLGSILAIAGPIDTVVELRFVCKKWREALCETALLVSAK